MGCSNVRINPILHHKHSESLTEDICLRKSGACLCSVSADHSQRSTSTLACSPRMENQGCDVEKSFNVFVKILSRSPFYLSAEIGQNI